MESSSSMTVESHDHTQEVLLRRALPMALKQMVSGPRTRFTDPSTQL